MAEPNELITWLSVKIKPDSESNLKKIDDGIEAIKRGASGLSNFFFGAGGAIDYFKKTIMGGSQELENLSNTTGVSIENLQKWKYAAEASGQSFRSITGDLENFRKLGMDALSLSGKLSGMSQRTAMQWKDKLGLSDEMFNILRKGPDSVKKLLSEAQVVPERDIRKAAAADREFQKTMAQVDEMVKEIMIELAPVVLETLKYINEFIRENKEWIKQNLGPVLKGLLALLAGQKIISLLENLSFLSKLAVIAKVIELIWDVLNDYFNKGVEETVDEIDRKIETGKATWGEVLNPAKAVAREYGHAGRFLGDLFSTPAEDSFKMFEDHLIKNKGYVRISEQPIKENIKKESNINNSSVSNNTTNSGNTIYLQMPYEQAVDFTRNISGGALNAELMAMSPGGFGGNFQP